ncbi:hypothetical protein ES319_D02G227000v1 [Gossypium barbadense]|uniref:Uncharacterized protein n=1 Tax=Gossypium barbadense TaxID=3634 RepID=A0A5J5SGA5_GOSBA|nr:hypothetical protein ES319_D02G227000v1 [Gossypium barbadense]
MKQLNIGRIMRRRSALLLRLPGFVSLLPLLQQGMGLVVDRCEHAVSALPREKLSAPKKSAINTSSLPCIQ